MAERLPVITAKVPPGIVDEARKRSGLPADASPSALVRMAMALLAGHSLAEARNLATAPKPGPRPRAMVP